MVPAVNGRAAPVVQDAAPYQTPFGLSERPKAVTGRSESEPGAGLDAPEREVRARDEPRGRPA